MHVKARGNCNTQDYALYKSTVDIDIDINDTMFIYRDGHVSERTFRRRFSVKIAAISRTKILVQFFWFTV